jgi:hypothetical protein
MKITVENLKPNLAQEVCECIMIGARIEYTSGIILAGDVENKYVDVYIDTGLTPEKLGIFDLSESGIVEGYLDAARTLFERGLIDGLQVVDEDMDPVGFESFEILEYYLALETIEEEGGRLLIIQKGDVEKPEYVGFDN